MKTVINKTLIQYTFLFEYTASIFIVCIWLMLTNVLFITISLEATSISYGQSTSNKNDHNNHMKDYVEYKERGLN